MGTNIIELKKKLVYYQEMYESKQSMLEMTVGHMEQVEQELKVYSEELETSSENLQKINNKLQDSINYAERLQKAILPEHTEIMKIFPQSFVHFNPKFKLSGDFYWFGETKKRKYVSVVDCTGHGVPGAMITVMIDSALNHLVRNQKIKSPKEIIKEVDYWVDNRLHRPQDNANKLKVRDGADASVMVYNEETNKLTFCGAHSSAFLVRDGKMTYIKGARYSIGENSWRKDNLEDTTIKVKKGDRFYMYTDGATDQFGGERNKKLGRRKLSQVILGSSDSPMEEQKEIIASFINEWKGDNPQTDDILVAGIQF